MNPYNIINLPRYCVSSLPTPSRKSYIAHKETLDPAALIKIPSRTFNHTSFFARVNYPPGHPQIIRVCHKSPPRICSHQQVVGGGDVSSFPKGRLLRCHGTYRSEPPKALYRNSIR